MITPYRCQLEAVTSAVKSRRGTISMPTGSGKSLTMALLINALQVRTLCVVPNLTLKSQLIQTFTKYFGNLDNITVCNIDDRSLKNKMDYDLVIIDECHHVAASTYRKLNKTAWKNIYYRFCFSATPFRSRDEEQLLYEAIAGQVIYKLAYQEALNHGMIVPVEAYYIDLPSEDLNLVGSYASVYKKGVVQSQNLNILVADLLIKLHTAKFSTLCIVKEIEHGEHLSSLSSAAFANGQSEDCRQLIDWFSSGKLKALIGTHGVVGEGVDSRACEYVLLPIPVKSKNLFMQIVGRAVRKYPGKESAKIILFKNNNHAWFKKAFKEQCKILADEFGIIPKKLEI